METPRRSWVLTLQHFSKHVNTKLLSGESGPIVTWCLDLVEAVLSLLENPMKIKADLKDLAFTCPFGYLNNTS